MANAKGGRPAKLTKELIDLIATDVEAGMFVAHASAKHGISSSTWLGWRREGARMVQADEEAAAQGFPKFRRRKYEALQIEFSSMLDVAEAIFAGNTLGVISAAGVKDWRAAAWVLGQRFPDLFGNRGTSRTEHTGAGGGPIETAGTPGEVTRAIMEDSDAREIILAAARRGLGEPRPPADAGAPGRDHEPRDVESR